MADLQITTTVENDDLMIQFTGSIDENCRFQDIVLGEAKRIVLDLAGVRLINSVGLRGWIIWMKQSLKDRAIVFRRCPKVVVDQMNILEGFVPTGAVVESFSVPYFCENCDHEESRLFTRGVEFEAGAAGRSERITPRTLTCPACGKPMAMDVIESKYFRFLKFRR